VYSTGPNAGMGRRYRFRAVELVAIAGGEGVVLTFGRHPALSRTDWPLQAGAPVAKSGSVSS